MNLDLKPGDIAQLDEGTSFLVVDSAILKEFWPWATEDVLTNFPIAGIRFDAGGELGPVGFNPSTKGDVLRYDGPDQYGAIDYASIWK